jgi:hypothetical protein
MARNATALRVLIASPSDVERERETLTSVINRWNAANSTSTGIILEPIRWETHTYPDTGDYPQGIINRQIVDDSDILVGVFWSRLGTPTPAAPSGTVEEIERLRARGKRVLLYFSRAEPPKGCNREQLILLQHYKQAVQKDTLYGEFGTPEELDRLFSQHLASVVNTLKTELNAAPRSGAAPTANLVTLRPLPAARLVSPDDSDTWHEGEEGLPAAIAIFRNDPIKGVPLGRIEGLTAQITFYEASGGEVQRVYRGCWLGDPFNHTQLSVGNTRELIIAVDRGAGGPPATIENTRTNSANYEYEGTSFKPLDRLIYDVNVRLVGHVRSEADVVEDFHFNVDLRETPRLERDWTR